MAEGIIPKEEGQVLLRSLRAYGDSSNYDKCYVYHSSSVLLISNSGGIWFIPATTREPLAIVSDSGKLTVTRVDNNTARVVNTDTSIGYSLLLFGTGSYYYLDY